MPSCPDASRVNGGCGLRLGVGCVVMILLLLPGSLGLGDGEVG